MSRSFLSVYSVVPSYSKRLTLRRSKPCALWDFQNPLFNGQFGRAQGFGNDGKGEGMTRVGHY